MMMIIMITMGKETRRESQDGRMEAIFDGLVASYIIG
jgi:hypothetical protein